MITLQTVPGQENVTGGQSPCHKKDDRGTVPRSHFLNKIGDLIDQLLCFFPAEAGIGDGLAVAAASGLLGSVLQIALYHEAFEYVRYPLVVAG